MHFSYSVCQMQLDFDFNTCISERVSLNIHVSSSLMAFHGDFFLIHMHDNEESLLNSDNLPVATDKDLI